MSRIKLLLVDDERAYIDILAQRLRRRGFDAACAYSGHEALRRLKEASEPDVVILDLKMPEMDGIETIQRIKAGRPLTEVILLTGHATVASAVDALKRGAFDYLLKPYALEELVDKIKAAARRKQHHEARIREVRAKPYISDRDREEMISRIIAAARMGISLNDH